MWYRISLRANLIFLHIDFSFIRPYPARTLPGANGGHETTCDLLRKQDRWNTKSPASLNWFCRSYGDSLEFCCFFKFVSTTMAQIPLLFFLFAMLIFPCTEVWLTGSWISFYADPKVCRSTFWTCYKNTKFQVQFFHGKIILFSFNYLKYYINLISECSDIWENFTSPWVFILNPIHPLYTGGAKTPKKRFSPCITGIHLGLWFHSSFFRRVEPLNPVVLTK